MLFWLVVLQASLWKQFKKIHFRDADGIVLTYAATWPGILESNC